MPVEKICMNIFGLQAQWVVYDYGLPDHARYRFAHFFLQTAHHPSTHIGSCYQGLRPKLLERPDFACVDAPEFIFNTLKISIHEL